MQARLDRARTFLGELDAILFAGRVNIAYLSGFTGTEASLLLTRDDAWLSVDSRYTTQARRETTLNVREIVKRWEETYAHVKELGLKTIGVESQVMDFDTVAQIREVFEGIAVKPLGKQLKDLRLFKDEHEIARMREAARIAEAAVHTVLERGIIGRPEREVALDIEWEMRRAGAAGVSFDLIVASGERSAMPHGVASSRVIARDEPVVIDFGCIYDGYCSDQTITVFTGQAGEEFAQTYARVWEAQQKAIAGLGPGVAAVEVDRLARGHLEAHGLGGSFGHGLGHGVGREIHEAPTVSQRSEDTLAPGMVITIEPGVYFPGKFGIRLEDCFVITDTSCQALTNMAKGAIIKTT